MTHTAPADRYDPLLYPVHLAIARHKGAERVIAVDAKVGPIDHEQAQF